MWGRFRKAMTLAPAYLWGLCCSKAGIPTFIVGPPASGKSTVIEAVGRYLEGEGEAVYRVSRMAIRDLKHFSKEWTGAKEVVVLNDDFSLIGSSDYVTERMAEIIASLGYGGQYVYKGMEVEISVSRFGFLSGVQPYWVRHIHTHRAFSTHIREKCLRYYLLPFREARPIRFREAVKLLVSNTREYKFRDVKVPESFMEALSLQVGPTRAEEYVERLSPWVSLYCGKYARKVMEFWAKRIAFEDYIIERTVEKEGFEVKSYWQAYTVLYWVLRLGETTINGLCPYLGLKYHETRKLVMEALKKGWVEWNTPHVRASGEWRGYLSWC